MTRFWTSFRYLLFASAILRAYFNAQMPLANLDAIPLPGRWDEPVNSDATGNLILQSLAGLMQMAPNSKYPNGAS